MAKTPEMLIEEVNTLLSRMGVLLEEIRSIRKELSTHLVTETGKPDWSDACCKREL